MKDDSVFLKHILDSIGRIESYIVATSRDQFMQSSLIQDAVIRQLEIIGEAARNLSEDTRSAHPQVEWSSIIGMRNRLIHAYFQVDVDLVWDIVSADLPLLRGQIEETIDR